MNQKRPGVGVGVFILHERRILMSYRKDNGLLALPGGHLERFETFEECAQKEVLEEVGITLNKSEFWKIVNVPVREADYHYVVIFMKTNYDGQEVKNTEPHNHDDWFWVDEQTFQQALDDKKLFYGNIVLAHELGGVKQLFDQLFMV